MLLVQNAKHLFSLNLERDASDNGRGGGHPKLARRGDRFLADKVPGGEQRNRGLFALLGDDRQFRPASLEIKHRVGCASLGKEDLLCLETNDLSSDPCARQI